LKKKGRSVALLTVALAQGRAFSPA